MKEDLRKRVSQSILSDVGAMAGFNDLKDDLLEAIEMQTSARALRSMWWYYSLKHVRRVDFVILLIISFYERPLWCTTYFLEHCRISPDGTAIPTSNISYLPSLVYYPLEAILILFLTYNRYLKQVFVPNRETKTWFRILCALTTIIIVEGVIKSIFNEYNVNVSLVLKPIYFISFNRDLRKSLKTYILVVRKVIPILILMATSTLFFSLLGRIIFFDQTSGNYFETSILDTYFNLIVLQTTSNFPDVMMDFYNTHRWAPVFFISYLILNLFVLLNTVLGVFYSSYKQSIERETNSFFLDRKKKLSMYMSRYLDMRSHRPSKSFSSGSRKDSTVTRFINKFKRMQERQNSEPIDRDQSQESLESVQIPQSKIVTFIDSDLWQIVMGLLALGMFLAMYFMVPDFVQGISHGMWTSILFIGNAVFLTEQIIKLFILGKRYVKSSEKYYIFDLFASVIIVILLIIFWASGIDGVLTPCMYLMCTRMARFFRLLLKVKEIGNICQSLYEFIPHFVKLFGVLIVMFFFFSAIGQHIFGGHMTYAWQQDIYNQTGEELYILNSFNDTATSLILLFELLIVNNWMVNVQTHEIIMSTKNVRFFFILWYFVSVVICMNVMIAFIIDNLVNKFPDDSNSNNKNNNNNNNDNDDGDDDDLRQSLRDSILSDISDRQSIKQQQRQQQPKETMKKGNGISILNRSSSNITSRSSIDYGEIDRAQSVGKVAAALAPPIQDGKEEQVEEEEEECKDENIQYTFEHSPLQSQQQKPVVTNTYQPPSVGGTSQLVD